MCKNGEKYAVDFACAKSHRIVILHNLTDMHRKASACIGLCVDRVPMAYQHVVVFVLVRNLVKQAIPALVPIVLPKSGSIQFFQEFSEPGT
jgi:hypothetical protein